MKKIVSGLLAICMLLTNIHGAAVVSAAADSKAENSENVAKVTFGTKNITENISMVYTAGATSYSYSNGKEVIKVDLVNSDYRQLNQNGRIYIDLNDKFFCGNTDGSEFLVTVDYVDSNNTAFNIKYDAFGNEQGNTETVYTGLTNIIKQHTFVISDADFANGQDGYDLELGFPDTRMGGVKRTSMFAGVTIERIPAKNPVYVDIKSDVPGHIFNYEDVPMFSETFTNYSDEEQKVTVKRIAENKLGNIDWQTTEELTLAAREVKTVETKLDLKDYGLYYYKVEISNEEFDFEKETQFSYVNTPQDGLFSSRMGYSIHINSEHPEDIARAQIEAVLKSGTKAVRDGITWAWNEGAKGNYSFGHGDRMLRLVKEYGLDPVFIASFGNTLYTPTDRSLPETDEEIQAYVNYVDAMIEKYDGENFKFELWNEPNLKSFATNSDPEIYAKFITKAAKMIKEKHPNVQLGALSLCGIQSPEETHHTKEFTQKAIDNGAFDYIEAGTFHPYYALTKPEHGGELNNTVKLTNMIKEAGYDNIKIWNTEIGWTTGKSGGRQFNDRQKSAWHQRYFVLWDEIPEFEYYHLYDFMKDGFFNDEREAQFGIIDSAYAPSSGIPMLATDAYVGITNMNNMLAACDHPTKIATDVEDVYAYQYRCDERDRDILVFWRSEDTTKNPIHVKLGTNKVILVDSYGNETVLESENGEYDLMPDFELSYIIGDFEKAQIESSELNISALNINAIPNDMVSFDLFGLKGIDALEIREENFVKLDESTNINSGSAHVNVQIPSLREDKTSFWLLLKSGEKTRSAIRIYLDKSAIFDANLNVTLKNKDYTNWSGYLNIKNNSQKNIIEGEINITEVGGDKISYKKVYTGPIPAGKSAELEVPIPRIYERNMKDIKYEIQLEDGTVYSLENSANFAFAPYAETAPLIDGVWSKGEWADNTYFVVDQKSQVKQITDWAGKDDLSAVIYTAWDYDNFYITAQVKDDVFCQKDVDGLIWQGDSLQFGLVYGEETNIQIGNFGTKYSEFGAAKTPEGDQMYRWMSEDDSKPAGTVENYKLAITRDDDTQLTTYEMAVPWSEILPERIEQFDPNRALGFSMLVNDNDGTGRRGWIEYASGIGEGKNTSLFTYLNLVNVE